MATTRRARVRSAASRVFALLIGSVLLIGAAIGVFLTWEAQTSARQEAEHVTAAIAHALSAAPLVRSAVTASDRPAAEASLRAYVESTRTGAGLDFITVMDRDGVRLTHPDPTQVGGHYLGTIPSDGRTLTEQYTGTLGPSVRTISPVHDAGGAVVGWVSAGVTVESLAGALLRRLPVIVLLTLAVVALGAVGAVLARLATRRITGDLNARDVRDAVAGFESVRTLGEALRAQTHEHGNRLHTALALLELDRKDEAIALLSDSSVQSQSVIDQMTLRDGDPTVAALLLGKASQAKERRVHWQVVVDPTAPRADLDPVDAVAVVGNLIDNALDAAGQDATDDAGRWVRVEIAPADGGQVAITVSDSGPGIPAELGDRVFEHGVSTKPSGRAGRGVGLALVRDVVQAAGGSITVTNDPTTFRVTMPAAPTKARRR
jgi:sensor histidine kinase regulating citrate/malate metabolism